MFPATSGGRLASHTPTQLTHELMHHSDYLDKYLPIASKRVHKRPKH